MKLTLSLLVGLGISFITPALAQSPAPSESQQQVPSLRAVSFPQGLGLDQQLWSRGEKSGDWLTLLRSIDNSLRYLDTPKAAQDYANYPIAGINRDRVRRSLVRFRQLVRTSPTPEALQASVQREFSLYKAAGRTNQGDVHFTGYFEPIYDASPVRTAEFPYPLYRQPSNFSSWKKPHPTRLELEGKDGMGKNSPLAGSELVWLRDRFEGFLVHIQGSAKMRFPDGKMISIGYAGKTDYPYTSVGSELVKDNVLPLEGLTLPILIDYFKANPEALDTYLPRNQSFVFFRETNGAPPTGSLGVPVLAERSIATDKSIMPPGALALIHTEIPYTSSTGELENQLVSRYVLDQDTGSAIRGAGRVDVFMGTGVEAGDRAGIMSSQGELYYLLLK